jgi:hypothetical protein
MGSKRVQARYVGLILAMSIAMIPAVPAGAIVGGERDCSYNALGTAGEGCSYPTVGAIVASFEPTGWVSGCTSRLIYNGPSAAVILTAAHCMQEGPEVRSGDGVTFDSQTVDDSVNPYARHVVQPDRLIVPDEVILHPTARSSFVAGTDPGGNSQAFVDSDFALLVIDDPAKLSRLNSTWSLPYGKLVDLPAPGFFDTLTPRAFRELPLIDVGYGRDWINSDRPSGQQNTGRQDGNNGGFRSVADLTPKGVSQDRLLTSQIPSKGEEGICYSDSGSSAFLPAGGGRLPMIVAMPTWVNDGGTKCASTVQWTRLDRPNALDFIGCGLVAGGAEATRACVEQAFPPNS